MADASEEGTAQGYNAGRSLLPSCFEPLSTHSNTKACSVGQEEGLCKPGAPLTTWSSGEGALLWREPLHSGVASVPSGHHRALGAHLNVLLLGALATWNTCCGGNLCFHCEELFLHVGEADTKQTSQLCGTATPGRNYLQIQKEEQEEEEVFQRHFSVGDYLVK